MVGVTLSPVSNHTTGFAAADAYDIARRLPRMTLEARRISATVASGLHGRRRAGQGENFWQYRPLSPGEPSVGIDWRRSARHSEQLYLREREWEAAHSVFIFIDRSASMRFRSALAQTSKHDRAVILGLALADCLVRAGERVALLGMTRPLAQANIIDRLAAALAEQRNLDDDLPSRFTLPPRSELVIIGDCLTNEEDLAQTLDAIRMQNARAHVLRILDPAEELFPFEGETELLGVEDQDRLMIGDAARFQQRYREIFAAHRDSIADLCRKMRTSLLEHRTDKLPTDALQALFARLADKQMSMVR